MMLGNEKTCFTAEGAENAERKIAPCNSAFSAPSAVNNLLLNNSRQVAMRRRRGAIFIVALGIIVVLSGLVLVFAQDMRTEGMRSANQVSYLQADAIELGAEQWLLANCEAYQGDALTVTQIPAAAQQVGSGYFWVLTPNMTDSTEYEYGITDESSKLNINTVTADELLSLPTNLPQNVADAIVDWRSGAGSASADGAETPYYESLPEPYDCKNGNYESVEEMLLVDDVTPLLLFGYDLNRDGVISAAEQNAESSAGTINTGQDPRGLFNFLTVYSQQPAVRGRNTTGLVNINTASEAVLMALPGMTQSYADDIISQRQSQDQPTTSWISTVIPQGEAGALTPYITAISYQYSADIVAVSGDGRSFKRVRVVVDCQQVPAKIVYRKDMTSLGWPLPADLRDALRHGQPIPADAAQNNAPSGT
jgi:DNA uptake protein ComE-like DNA-binding protein